MSIDYRWGAGYGIAIPVKSKYDCPELCAVLGSFLGVTPGRDDIFFFDGSEELDKLGLVLDTAGNSWTGTNYHALILDKTTVKSGEMYDLDGVLTSDMETGLAQYGTLERLYQELKLAGIESKQPQFLYYGEVS